MSQPDTLCCPVVNNNRLGIQTHCLDTTVGESSLQYMLNNKGAKIETESDLSLEQIIGSKYCYDTVLAKAGNTLF